MIRFPFLDFHDTPRSAFHRYGVAAGALVLTVGLGLVLDPYTGEHSPFLAFFIAIVFSAWYGGWGTGLFVTFAAAVITWYGFPPPRVTFAFGSAGPVARLLLFVGEGVLVSWLIAYADRERRRTRTLVESISDGFIVYDREWRITSVNRSAERMARRPRSELLGKRLGQAIPEIVGTAYEEGLRRAASANKPQRFEFGFARFDEWFEVDAYPSAEGVTVYVRDVSDKKRGLQALETVKNEIGQMNKQLEQRVEERTAQLYATIKELEAFSYSISHDLRAPLRAIDGFSKMLQEDYEGILDDEGRRILSVIRHNTVHMGQLIDGLLAFSRLGRQPIGHDAINMTELARDAMKEVLSGESERAVQFTVHELPAGAGDRLLLRQVFINLLSNAMKFTRQKNPAIIEVGAANNPGENIFFVKDNGAGFDMRYADKLFGVFQRLHGADEFEGTGLGLAIVQRVISRHGGRVWAEASVGHGATIYFSLPKT